MELPNVLTDLFRGNPTDAKAGRFTEVAGPGPAIHDGHPARLSQQEARRHLSGYGGDQAIDTVMACADLIASTASNAEYHFERDGVTQVAHKIPDVTPDDVEEADQRLVTLLEQPNPWMDYTELIELTFIDYLLVGNSYWLKYHPDSERAKDKPVALYRLAPPLVTVVPGERDLVDHYVYRVPGREEIKIPADQVLHFKRPNPHDPHFGLGLIAGGARAMDIELAITDSQARYYEQGTRLSGVLETDRNLPDTLISKIRRQFRAMYAGNENAYHVATLERGLKFRPISSTAAEAEFRHLAPMSRQRIAMLFRVPIVLLGIIDNADRQAVREAQRIFDNKTMRPLLNQFQHAISIGLTQAWGVNFVVDHEYVMPIEDQVELAADVAALPGIRVREVRERLGYDPLGDERDDIVLNLPGSNDNDSEVKDRRNAEGGRPPDGENTAAIPEPGEAMPADAEASR